MSEEEWRHEGSAWIGRKLTRTVHVDGETSKISAEVIGWLDEDESDFVDDNGAAAALYRITYTDGDMAGECEDLEEHQLLDSVSAESKQKMAAPKSKSSKKKKGRESSTEEAPPTRKARAPVVEEAPEPPKPPPMVVSQPPRRAAAAAAMARGFFTDTRLVPRKDDDDVRSRLAGRAMRELRAETGASWIRSRDVAKRSRDIAAVSGSTQEMEGEEEIPDNLALGSQQVSEALTRLVGKGELRYRMVDDTYAIIDGTNKTEYLEDEEEELSRRKRKLTEPATSKRLMDTSYTAITTQEGSKWPTAREPRRDVPLAANISVVTADSPDKKKKKKQEDEEPEVVEEEEEEEAEEDEEELFKAAEEAATTAASESAKLHLETRSVVLAALAIFKVEMHGSAVAAVMDGHELNHEPAPGWYRELVERQSADKVDVYYYTPEGTLVRSRPDVKRYFEAQPSSSLITEEDGETRRLTPDDFSFSAPKKSVEPEELQRCRKLSLEKIRAEVQRRWDDLSGAERAEYDAKAEATKLAVKQERIDAAKAARDAALEAAGGTSPMFKKAALRATRANFPDVGFDLLVEEGEDAALIEELETEEASSMSNNNHRPQMRSTRGGQIVPLRARPRRAASANARYAADAPKTRAADIVFAALECILADSDDAPDWPKITEVVADREKTARKSETCPAFTLSPYKATRDGLATLLRSGKARRILADLDGDLEWLDNRRCRPPASLPSTALAAWRRHLRSLGALRALTLAKLQPASLAAKRDDLLPPVVEAAVAQEKKKRKSKVEQPEVEEEQEEEEVMIALPGAGRWLGRPCEIDGIRGAVTEVIVVDEDDDAKRRPTVKVALEDGSKRTLEAREALRVVSRCDPCARWPDLERGQQLMNTMLQIWWDGDAVFYPGTIVAAAHLEDPLTHSAASDDEDENDNDGEDEKALRRQAKLSERARFEAENEGWQLLRLGGSRGKQWRTARKQYSNDPQLHASKYLVLYEDGTSDWYNLASEKVRYEKAANTVARMEGILDDLAMDDQYGLFQQPVDPVAEQLPNYHEFVHKPMDLGTVRRRLNADVYDEDVEDDALRAVKIEENCIAEIKQTYANAVLFYNANKLLANSGRIQKLAQLALTKVEKIQASEARQRKQQSQLQSANTRPPSARAAPANYNYGNDYSDDEDVSDGGDDSDEDFDEAAGRRAQRKLRRLSAKQHLVENALRLDQLLNLMPRKSSPDKFTHPPHFRLTRAIIGKRRIEDRYRLIKHSDLPLQDEEAGASPVPESRPAAPTLDLFALAAAEDEAVEEAAPPPRVEEAAPPPCVEEAGPPAMEAPGAPMEVEPQEAAAPAALIPYAVEYVGRDAVESEYFEHNHFLLRNLEASIGPYVGDVVHGEWEIRPQLARKALSYVLATLVLSGHVVELADGAGGVMFVAANAYKTGAPFDKRKKGGERPEDILEEDLSEYELARKAKMAANHAFLVSLGLAPSS